MHKGKNTKVIGLIKDELVGKIMIEFVGLRTKTISYLIDDGSEDKKAKDSTQLRAGSRKSRECRFLRVHNFRF